MTLQTTANHICIVTQSTIGMVCSGAVGVGVSLTHSTMGSRVITRRKRKTSSDFTDMVGSGAVGAGGTGGPA